MPVPTDPASLSHHRFHLRPLVLAAAGFACGVFLAYQVSGMPVVFAVCLFLFFGALFFLSRNAVYAILFLSLAAGMLRMAAALPTLPQEGEYEVKGTLAAEAEAKQDHTLAVLYGVTLDGKPLSGRVQIRLPKDAAKKLQTGDTVCVFASLRIPEKTPGSSFDPRAYYLSEGITALAYTKAIPKALSHRIGPNYRLAAFRMQMHNALSLAYGEEAPLAAALLMNDKSFLSDDVQDAFRGAGVAHILALSGLHVSVFVSMLAAVLPKRLPLLRFLLAALFLSAYCLIANFPPSLIRASVMALLTLAAPLADRRYDSPSALAAALLLILLFSPASLFSVGLQLSFAATGAILLLQRPLASLFRRLPKALSGSLSVTLAGTFGTLPPTVLYFGQLPLYTVFANMIIVPLMGILLPLVLFGTAAVALSPDALWCAMLPKQLLIILRLLTEEFASLPFAVLRLSVPKALPLLPLYGAMLMLSPYHLRPKREKLQTAALFLLLSAAMLFILRCMA